VRKNDDDHADVSALLKYLYAVQQHRFAGNPPELLQLLPARADTLSAGDNHNADVSAH
jgi:hypothetical protein